MSNNGIETGGDAVTTQQCPKKRNAFADALASDPSVDPADVFLGGIEAFSGTLDCDCEFGPQPKTLLRRRLPEFFGQVCGRECVDRS